MSNAKRLNFPSTGRNAEPILQVLKKELPPGPCTVLEIASGSGQHAVHFCAAMAQLNYWPSDLDPAHIDSIKAWRDHANSHGRIQPPSLVNVCAPQWETTPKSKNWPAFFDAIVNINMIHIAPWEATLGLMRGVARLLRPGGILFFYGPFKQGGVHSAPSNADFDENLHGRNPDWGVRDLDDVTACAKENSLKLRRTVAMPANNLCVLYEKG